MEKQRGYFDGDYLVIWLLIAAMVGLMVLMVAAADADAKSWNAFKAAHDCKVVAKISGEVFNTIGVGANGQVAVGVGTTADKTGWACNDGITYYR